LWFSVSVAGEITERHYNIEKKKPFKLEWESKFWIVVSILNFRCFFSVSFSLVQAFKKTVLYQLK
jgi:hypothetical protein